MREPSFYAAVFGIIRDSEGKILFQKRQNTGYRDGAYQLPSGHLEKDEGMSRSLVRELQEEIDITPVKFEVKHINHLVEPGKREYFNIYFEIQEYDGDIKNLEEDKCSELYWANWEEIMSNPLFSKDREIIEYIQKGIHISETSPGETDITF